MPRLLLLTSAFWILLASCHILGGYEELEARDDHPTTLSCVTVNDCPGPSTICADWSCDDGICRVALAADGAPCLDSTCRDGACLGYHACDRQEDCLAYDMVCDLAVGLCVSCTEELCANAFPGTFCLGGLCSCPTGKVFCRGHGCVAPLPFDADCDPCQLRCPGTGCVDPYGSTRHCGGCGVECVYGECLRGSCQCDQAICDDTRPGTTCVDGRCQCAVDLTWCPGYGCVTPLPFDEFCAPCQIRCGKDGCVDPYGSWKHCGGCTQACRLGCVDGECGTAPPSEP